MARRSLLAAAAAALLLQACAPKGSFNQGFEKTGPRVVALLPVKHPSDMPRERAELVRKTLASELGNHGYLVLENAIVSSVCDTPECPERNLLAERYLVDGFAILSIESASRGNFIGAYYNTISGDLRFLDRSGNELGKVDHTERESGGVLLQSGQVFEGVRSQIESGGDPGFSKLAQKFVYSLVSSLPESGRTDVGDSTPVSVTGVSTRLVGPEVYEVCSRGTPNSFAYLVVPPLRTNLRETAPGVYCGTYRLDETAVKGPGVVVELRSPYGNSVHHPVPALEPAPCSTLGKAELVAGKDPPKLALSCDSPGAPQGAGGCSTGGTGCNVEKLLVYRAPTEEGPFLKVAEVLRPRSSIIEAPFAKPDGLYSLVSVDRRGGPSVPVNVSAEKPESARPWGPVFPSSTSQLQGATPR